MRQGGIGGRRFADEETETSLGSAGYRKTKEEDSGGHHRARLLIAERSIIGIQLGTGGKWRRWAARAKHEGRV